MTKRGNRASLSKGLTPQLQHLVGRHDAWWTRWANELDARDKPTTPVFHYTNWDGFCGIIQSKSFWLHSIFHMNDTEELSYGWDIARCLLLERNFEGYLANCELMKEFCAGQLAPDRLCRIKERLDFYSISFGVRDDDRQWWTYGDERRGVAIGLEPRLFANVSTCDPLPEDKTYVAKVLYGRHECTQRHREAIAIALDILEEAGQRKFVTTGASGIGFKREIATLMNVALAWNSVTTKSADWKHEHELRMLATNDLTAPQFPILYHNNRRPYVVIPFPRGANGIISEIMVGADAVKGAEDEVRTLLRASGLGDLPPISRARAQT